MRTKTLEEIKTSRYNSRLLWWRLSTAAATAAATHGNDGCNARQRRLQRTATTAATHGNARRRKRQRTTLTAASRPANGNDANRHHTKTNL